MAKQPFVPVANVLRIKFVGLNQGSPWVNDLAVQYATNKPTEADLNTYALQLNNIWNTNIAALCLTNASLQTVQVWDITDDHSPSGVNSTVRAGTAVVGASLPVQAAVCVSWPVASRWRGGHFRTYQIARNGTDITSGRNLGTTYAAAVKTAYDGMRTAINALAVGSGTNGVLGGVRYFPTGTGADGKPVLRTSGQFFPFGASVIHNRLDTQRRRLGKELA